MEVNKRLCKICKELKTRITDGKFDAKNKRYVDENGWLWSGNYCPKCQLEKVRAAMKNKRAKEKGDINGKED